VASRTAWAPLRSRGFRVAWTSLLAFQTVLWLHTVAAVSVLTGLHASPAILALVQTAASLPIFLLVLPAGVLADVVDRRLQLLVAQAIMLACLVVLAVLVERHAAGTRVVLGLTFGVGVGVALLAPVYQAAIPDLVAADELPMAVSLNGVAINLARAVGPALGGLIVAIAGGATTFAVEAGLVVALLGLTLTFNVPQLPEPDPEPVGLALNNALRFARFSLDLRSVLARAGTFILCASALWALLPVVATQELHLHAFGLGLLFGCVGAGAIAGAQLLPVLRDRFGLNRLVLLGSAGLAALFVVLAVVNVPVLAGIALLAGGAIWIAGMSSFNIAAQHVAPAWVRARVLAIYQLVFQGGLAIGSALWGALANVIGVDGSLLCAAGVLIAVGASTVALWRLPDHPPDLQPALNWNEPAIVPGPGVSTKKPVLVELEYWVPDAEAESFLSDAHDVGGLRRRDGAREWALYRDAEVRERYVEHFISPSWEEHERQQRRMTRNDLGIWSAVMRFAVEPDGQAEHLLQVLER
jgi:MFS family permease